MNLSGLPQSRISQNLAPPPIAFSSLGKSEGLAECPGVRIFPFSFTVSSFLLLGFGVCNFFEGRWVSDLVLGARQWAVVTP